MRSRKEMTDFLTGHFRYNTLDSWNRSTSYANRMKIYDLGLTKEQESRLYELIGCEGAYDSVRDLINHFGADHDWKWQAAFNGRSGGYLVLYTGGWKPSKYRSYCTYCGQENYETVEETGCRCGKCGRDARVNYKGQIKDVFSYPVRPVDMGEDFKDWSMDELKERTKVVQEFDRLCDAIVAEAAYMADHCTVKEERIFVPKTQKRLVVA